MSLDIFVAPATSETINQLAPVQSSMWDRCISLDRTEQKGSRCFLNPETSGSSGSQASERALKRVNTQSKQPKVCTSSEFGF